MKKRLLCLLLCLALTIPFMGTVKAASSNGSRCFYPLSCNRNGSTRSFTGEYLVLNDDGSGIFVHYGCAFTIEWSGGNGEPFRFTTNDGRSFTGSLEGSTVKGTFTGGYEYVLRLGGDAPVMSLAPENWGKGLPCVTDQAGILTRSEVEKLSAKAEKISRKYSCGVYIIVLDDMERFSFAGKRAVFGPDFSIDGGFSYHGELNPVETCAEELRAGYALGWGPDHDCILLLLSMAERDYDLETFGNFAGASFTDYGKEYLAKRFLDDFRKNDWAKGFSDYLDCCEELLGYSAAGKPLDVGNVPVNPVLALIASLVPAFLIAFIICSVLKRQMKPTKEQTEAASYVPQNGVEFTLRTDRFIRTSEKRVYSPPSESKSSGGGGTSHSSSGHSHSSGKF